MSRSGREFSPVSTTGEGRLGERSFRLRKRSPRDPQQSDMVIRALVRARLLGIQLLTVEARVVVGTDNAHRPAVPPLIFSYSEPDSPGHRSPGRGLTHGSGPGLARAVELLEEGTYTLERTRRRSQLPPRHNVSLTTVHSGTVRSTADSSLPRSAMSVIRECAKACPAYLGS